MPAASQLRTPAQPEAVRQLPASSTSGAPQTPQLFRGDAMQLVEVPPGPQPTRPAQPLLAVQAVPRSVISGPPQVPQAFLAGPKHWDAAPEEAQPMVPAQPCAV